MNRIIRYIVMVMVWKWKELQLRKEEDCRVLRGKVLVHRVRMKMKNKLEILRRRRFLKELGR